jgi:hypothetical protein
LSALKMTASMSTLWLRRRRVITVAAATRSPM